MQSKKVNSETYRLKKVLVLALLFMMIGSLLELYLLEHYEDTWQLIPVICIGVALINFCVLLYRRSQAAIHLFKIVLVLTTFSGVYGVVLHLQSNFEFEQDMKPTASFWQLITDSIIWRFTNLSTHEFGCFSMYRLFIFNFNTTTTT